MNTSFRSPSQAAGKDSVPSLLDLPCYHLFCKPESQESQGVGPDLFSSRVRARQRAAGRPRRWVDLTQLWRNAPRFFRCKPQDFVDLMKSNEPKRLTLALTNPSKWVIEELDALIEEWRARQEWEQRIPASPQSRYCPMLDNGLAGGAKVPEAYWKATAKEMLEKVAGKGPELATDIAAKYLQGIT